MLGLYNKSAILPTSITTRAASKKDAAILLSSKPDIIIFLRNYCNYLYSVLIFNKLSPFLEMIFTSAKYKLTNLIINYHIKIVYARLSVYFIFKYAIAEHLVYMKFFSRSFSQLFNINFSSELF